MPPVRPYLFYDTATSVCATCLRRVEAKIVLQDGAVFLHKRCPAHGPQRVMLADDADYYRMAREQFIKAPEMPLRCQTPARWGCPYDCGLCPDHMQHSCLSLIELTDHCNLRCPICYADSGPHRPGYRGLAQIEAMLDAIVRSEGTPDVVQLSGGEPTLHPELFEILRLCQARPIRHLMLNTNGVRLSREPDFLARLAEATRVPPGTTPSFEIYLQFDSLRESVHRELRGADLTALRQQALEGLNRHQVPTTLVVTLKKGCNDDEIGAILDYALKQPCVRGVTFQPIQAAGRLGGYDPVRDRLTLTEVRRRIYEQSPHFPAEDILPVPCNPDALAMAYALRRGDQIVPLTGLIGKDVLLGGARNTISFERDEAIRQRVYGLLSTGNSPEGAAGKLAELLCCLPRVEAPGLTYKDVFRVLIVQFIDAHAFDLRAVKRSCIHIAQPDGRLVPFDTYNLFYRDDRVVQLGKIRAELDRHVEGWT